MRKAAARCLVCLMASTAAACWGQAERDANAWQREGLEAHLRNDFRASIPAFEQALRLDPDLWTSELFRGIGLYRTNRFAEALQAVERASKRATGQGKDEADYWLGAAHIALKNPLTGLRSLERLLARNPQHVDALELAARTYSDTSSALWNRVAEHHFDTPAGFEVHAHALEGEGNAAGAIEYFTKSQKRAPGRAGPARELGRLQGDAGQLRQAVKLAPSDGRAHYLLGLWAIQHGDLAMAAVHLDKAVTWSAADYEPAIALAQVLLGLKRPADAVRAARRGVEMAPASAAAHELLLAAAEQAGELEQAERERARWQERSGSRVSRGGVGSSATGRP